MDCAPGSISDTENSLTWDGDLDNHNDSEADWRQTTNPTSG